MSDRKAVLVDGDPLAAIESVILTAARRRTIAKQRRRRLLAVCGAPVVALTVTSAALAVVGVGTGVPPIDRYLDFLHDGAPSRVGAPSTPQLPGAPGADVRPQPGKASPSVDLVLADGTRLVALGYTNRNGDLCGALTNPERPQTIGNGFFGCAGSEGLRERLTSGGAPAMFVAVGQFNADVAIVQGLARADVKAVTVSAGTDTFGAAVTEPWQIDGWDGEAVRAFFVVVPAASLAQGGMYPLADLHIKVDTSK